MGMTVIRLNMIGADMGGGTRGESSGGEARRICPTSLGLERRGYYMLGDKRREGQ